MKKIFLRLTGILFFGLLFFISCVNVTTSGTFSVATPGGWLRKDTLSKDGSKRVQFTAAPKNGYRGFIENISISIIHSPDLDAYMSGVMEEVRKSADFFEVKGKDKIKIAEHTAKWVQIEVLFTNSSGDEIKEQKVYFIKDKGNIYMIVCTARKNGIRDIQGKIDEVINSFKIIKQKE